MPWLVRLWLVVIASYPVMEQVLLEKGILPGIKVDRGLSPIPGELHALILSFWSINGDGFEGLVRDGGGEME